MKENEKLDSFTLENRLIIQGGFLICITLWGYILTNLNPYT